MSDQDKKGKDPRCAECAHPSWERHCMHEEGKAGPACPTVGNQELLAKANREYDDPELKEFARLASLQESECYLNRDQKPYFLQPSKTRVQEIIEFAKKLGSPKVGLAFCVGLRKEAEITARIFKAHGLDVVSAVCKSGRTSKDTLGLAKEDTIFLDEKEAMCNPVYQAELLNQAGTGLNVLLGLCVGHDSMFFKYSQAPATVLAVKDRVTGHNPLAPIYLAESYYPKLLNP